jgi:AcrR family transcriptional regulator
MVRKPIARRGRPRSYDPDTALAQITATFWEAGYAATTLEELSANTDMNRPSLYAAFGDKRAMYQHSVDAYREKIRRALVETLRHDRPLREVLRTFYEWILTIYLSGDHGARGCFLIGTALTESVRDEAARGAVSGYLQEIEAALEARFRVGIERGELSRVADPAALAKLASAVQQSLAVRARSGTSQTALKAVVDAAIALICG